jgi:hypothetical protein
MKIFCVPLSLSHTLPLSLSHTLPLSLSHTLPLALRSHETGWPCVRGTFLSRPDSAGIWEAQSIEAAHPDQRRQQQLQQQAGPHGAGQGEVQTPEDVALIDPVAGLIQMEVRSWRRSRRRSKGGSLRSPF